MAHTSETIQEWRTPLSTGPCSALLLLQLRVNVTATREKCSQQQDPAISNSEAAGDSAGQTPSVLESSGAPKKGENVQTPTRISEAYA
ncbi:hypothetical protein T484DRAFT_1816617 [Baffinella frigidus]|nr:hypothetical protein T484DRAFT_1816617 [Cryptophyta sp. CCMP2293]